VFISTHTYPSSVHTFPLHIKAVPGAKQDQIAGLLGDRLKVRISAPPENGKANKAIQALIAKALDIKPNDITLDSGHSNPLKTFTITHPTLTSTQAALDHLTT